MERLSRLRGLLRFTWPLYVGLYPATRCSQAEVQRLGMLSKKARPGSHAFSLAATRCLQFNHCANGVSIALCSLQGESNNRSQWAKLILKYFDLWGCPVLQDHFQPAVAIDIAQSERPSILQAVQAQDACGLGKAPILVIDVEVVSLIATPRIVRAYALVDNIPCVFVGL